MTTQSITALVRSLGGVGLLGATFADSSFVTIPGVADLILIVLSIRHHDRMLYYAAMSTAGSLAGCFTAYFMARKAGDAVLRRRFSAQKINRGLEHFKRYGALAIILPAVLPPPAPFQIFVWLAGVSEMPLWTFGSSVVTGRAVRYFGEGLLAIVFGRQLFRLFNQHRVAVIVALCTAVGLAAASWFLWARARRARG